MSTLFEATPKELFFTRGDASDPRVGERVQPLDGQRLQGGQMVIGGFPDDEGISMNGGRPGAKLAPNAIRRYFYRMTPPLQRAPASPLPTLWDAGNLKSDVSLGDRHQGARLAARTTLKSGGIWVGLGGGHDYGYPDGAAFLDVFLNSTERPLVINIDAHLDVRPTQNGHHSGTPFYRLFNDFEGFDFAEVGIQPQCNSQEHLNWCLQQGGHVLMLDEVLQTDKTWAELVRNALPRTNGKRPCYLSIDLDAFSSAYAPGCSQSWATGLEPQRFLAGLRQITEWFDVRVLGLYEVSPPLDVDDRTSKWAAQILHTFWSLSGRVS